MHHAERLRNVDYAVVSSDTSGSAVTGGSGAVGFTGFLQGGVQKTVYDPTGHAQDSARGLVRQAAATGVQAAAMRKAAAKLSNRVTKSTAT